MGTAARIPEIKRIFWFDLENGVETLLHMGLTEEEMNKIIVVKIPDTKDNPIGIETVLKALTARQPIKICEEHGKVNCQVCAKAQAPFITFLLSDLTNSDLFVLDSGSQLGDSAMAVAMMGKEDLIKPTWDEYAYQGKLLSDAMSVIQAAKHTNFVVITHELAAEDESGKDKIYPLVGTKPFSMKVAKYFGTVVYVHKKMNKHVAGSSSLYRGDLMTGSRVNAAIEKNGVPDMRTILIEGGIIKSDSGAPVEKKEVADPPPIKASPLASIIAKKSHTQ